MFTLHFILGGNVHFHTIKKEMLHVDQSYAVLYVYHSFAFKQKALS